VVHAHRFALAVERVAAERLGVTAADRLFASSRLFFVYPLANSVFAGLKLGACVVLDPAWPSPEMAARVVTSARPSVFFAVPSLLRDLLHAGHAPALAASGLRLAVSAGEALPPTLRQAWQQSTGVPLVNGYGASETMCLVLLDTGQGLQPAPGVQLRWAEADHAAGTPGRIWVQAPTQALGYWQRPEDQAEHFRAGGFCPADLFEQEGEGGVWRFAGREDSLVKISGRWVDLAALSEQLVVPATAATVLSEAAAVAVPDADGVQAIALFYVARADALAEAARELADRVRDLPPHQRPRWLHAVPQFPRTPTGKLLRRQLQQMHAVLLQAQSARTLP
jgi:acyl-coenzyme A synthetase/AMP-(fatty) acid ligase